MGMQASSRTFNPYFLHDGRIVNKRGEKVFTDRTFSDVIEACYWLNFVSLDARFGTPYIEVDESRRNDLFVNRDGPNNHYVAPRQNHVQSRSPEQPRPQKRLTLGEWLMRNGLDPTKPLDPELLDALPTELRNQITEEK